MPHLKYTSGGASKIMPLDKERKIRIGRCESCEICLENSPKASRTHCNVYYYAEGDCYALGDLGSTNGTFLNGSRISSDVILSDGDSIGVGGESILFVSGSAIEAQGQVKKAEPVKVFNLSDIPKLEHTQSLKMPSDMSDELRMALAVPHEFGFNPGDRIGVNTVKRKLADSQMASVFVVESPELDEDICLKIFKKPIKDEVAQEEFLDAVQEAAKLKLDGFTRYIEAGVHGNRHCYFLMDFLDSPTLAKRISRKAPFIEDECLETVGSIARSLEAAYTSAKLIHRNLNPSNILYTKEESPSISDYGMASWESKYIAGNVSIASPWYISPEQIAGRRIGWHSDLYSLGIILFHMLTGVLPFHSTVEDEVLGMHLHSPFPQPVERNPNIRVSNETAALLQVMTDKDPSCRYPSWSAFIRGLESALDHQRKATRRLAPFLPEKTADKIAAQAPAVQTHAKRKKLTVRK